MNSECFSECSFFPMLAPPLFFHDLMRYRRRSLGCLQFVSLSFECLELFNRSLRVQYNSEIHLNPLFLYFLFGRFSLKSAINLSFV